MFFLFIPRNLNVLVVEYIVGYACKNDSIDHSSVLAAIPPAKDSAKFHVVHFLCLDFSRLSKLYEQPIIYPTALKQKCGREK